MLPRLQFARTKSYTITSGNGVGNHRLPDDPAWTLTPRVHNKGSNQIHPQPAQVRMSTPPLQGARPNPGHGNDCPSKDKHVDELLM
eukprot:4832424-Amphidinium_carterae.1